MIVFVYDLSPHIGLKNIQVLAMYSNLKTEGGSTNHFFIPSSIQVFDNLRNLAEIKGSSIGGLNKFSHYSKLMPVMNTKIAYSKNYINYRKHEGVEVKDKYKYLIPLFELQNIITSQANIGVKDIELSYKNC